MEDDWTDIKIPLYELKYNPHTNKYRIWRSTLGGESDWVRDQCDYGPGYPFETRFKWRALNLMAKMMARDHEARVRGDGYFVSV